jgi:hypothetical protein
MTDGTLTEADRRTRHALYCGAITGIGMKHGVMLLPVYDENNEWVYGQMELRLRDDCVLRVVVPEPPDDWHLEDWT